MSNNRDLSAAAAQIGFHNSNIGIGTDAPTETITLNHANGASIGLEYDGTENGTINVNSAAMYARAGSGKHLILGANATESLRITSTGVINCGHGDEINLHGSTTTGINLNGNGNSGQIVANASDNRALIIGRQASYGQVIEFFQGSNINEAAITIPAADSFGIETAGTERLRITSAGNIGINKTPTTYQFEVNGGTANTVASFESTDATSRILFKDNSGEAMVGAIGDALTFYTSTNATERLRIDANGTLLVNAAIDNTGGHGQIVAHAPTSGNTIYKAIEIGNTNGNGTARGAAICGQPKSNSHLPYTLIGSWDHGDDTDVYYGGGWGGAMRPATRHRFYTSSSYPTTGGSGTEVIRITENGDLGINILDPLSKLHVNLTKSSGSTTAERTKQHAAMRLSLDRTSGSMPYQGWGPALDFYSDNYDGSTQRPNARIAGVISNYSLGDEGGELRFYTTPTDTATGESDFAQRMTITSAGYVLKTQQPAFFVYRNQSAWTLAANDVFVFNTAELNVGGHYNTSNGRFTAPITGRYVFHFFSIFTGNALSDSIEMYKNSARMYGGDVHFTNSLGSAWDCVHYSRVIQLSSGDYVHMQTRTGHTFHGNHWGGWSGYMLG